MIMIIPYLNAQWWSRCWQWVATTQQRMDSSILSGQRSMSNESMKSSMVKWFTCWPVALSQIHAVYEEVLHSPVPLVLSSHPPHLWTRTDEQMHDFGNVFALNTKWIKLTSPCKRGSLQQSYRKRIKSKTTLKLWTNWLDWPSGQQSLKHFYGKLSYYRACKNQFTQSSRMHIHLHWSKRKGLYALSQMSTSVK